MSMSIRSRLSKTVRVVWAGAARVILFTIGLLNALQRRFTGGGIPKAKPPRQARRDERRRRKELWRKAQGTQRRTAA